MDGDLERFRQLWSAADEEVERYKDEANKLPAESLGNLRLAVRTFFASTQVPSGSANGMVDKAAKYCDCARYHVLDAELVDHLHQFAAFRDKYDNFDKEAFGCEPSEVRQAYKEGQRTLKRIKSSIESLAQSGRDRDTHTAEFVPLLLHSLLKIRPLHHKLESARDHMEAKRKTAHRRQQLASIPVAIAAAGLLVAALKYVQDREPGAGPTEINALQPVIASPRRTPAPRTSLPAPQRLNAEALSTLRLGTHACLPPATRVPVRQAPDAEGLLIAELARDAMQEFKVDSVVYLASGDTPSWYAIEYADGRRGWIHRDGVGSATLKDSRIVCECNSGRVACVRRAVTEL